MTGMLDNFHKVPQIRFRNFFFFEGRIKKGLINKQQEQNMLELKGESKE